MCLPVSIPKKHHLSLGTNSELEPLSGLEPVKGSIAIKSDSVNSKISLETFSIFQNLLFKDHHSPFNKAFEHTVQTLRIQKYT